MPINSNKGFSMIEILVALVILAIGLLGMASLMLNSLQTSQSAALRSAATLAAYDLIERMRSNTDEEVLKNPTYITGGLKTFSQLATGAPSTPDACNQMTAKDLAKCQQQVWARDLLAKERAILPDNTLVLVKTNGTVTTAGVTQFRLYCIAILWEDNGGRDVTGAGDEACGQPISSSFTGNKPWTFYEVKVLL